MKGLAEWAKVVDDAMLSATAIPQITENDPLAVEDAYAIQALAFSRRLGRGERQVGMKMGFTSKVKMVQMGVDQMIWGRLSDAMRVEEGGEVSRARYVHPRAEPEVAFLMSKPLAGLVSPAEALDAVEAVAPAIEIIDSRFKAFKFSLADVVADNSSSSSFVVGGWNRPGGDLTNLGMILEFDFRPVQIGSTAAILGDPVRSLVAAARLLGEQGLRLEPGWVVMAGAATAAQAVEPGTHVRNVVQGLGTVQFRVEA